jgi:ankyrin repeat protein
MNRKKLNQSDYAIETSPDARLLAAIGRGNIGDATRALIDGANPNAISEGGISALKEALGHWDIVKMLIGAGADVLTRNKEGEGILHWAAQYNEPDVINKAILEWGLDVNARDTDGWTPLHHAASWDALEAVQELLENDADPMIKSNPNAFVCPDMFPIDTIDYRHPSAFDVQWELENAMESTEEEVAS